MSTDYFFKCNKCDLISRISFSMQAWGWGNCWPTNTFSFIIKHTSQCGEEHVRCVSEYFALESETDEDIPVDFTRLRGFIEHD